MELSLTGYHSHAAISEVSFDANNNITLKYNYLIINFLAAWLKCFSKIKVYYKKNELKAGFVVNWNIFFPIPIFKELKAIACSKDPYLFKHFGNL